MSQTHHPADESSLRALDAAEPEADESDAGGSIWRNRPFMRLWAAQAIGQTAQNVVWYGILVLVQRSSNSSTYLSLAILTLMLPSVFFGIIAGVYVDRWNKRWVLVGTNALRMVVTLFYPFADVSIIAVLALNFLFATLSQFFSPAEASMIPVIVRRRNLLAANSLFNLTYTASQLAGLVIVGPLVVNLFGINAVFYVVSVLFLICVLLVFQLPSHTAKSATTYASTGEALMALVNDARQVALFVLGDREVLLALGHWTLSSILGIMLAVLAPGFVVNVLGIDAADSVFILAPAGVGMVIGTALLNRFGQWFDKHWITNAGLVVVSASMLILGLLGPAWGFIYVHVERLSGGAIPLLGFYGLVSIVMLIALVAGVAFVAIFVPAQTIMQERTPVELRGRLFAVAMVLSNLASIGPLLLAGAIADVLGVARAFTLLGLCLFAVTAASISQSPRSGRGLLDPAGRS